MPTIESAKKRLRQSAKRRERNKAVKSEIRTRARKIREMESAEEAREELNAVYALLDRAASRNIIHPKKAGRKKAQLARHVRSLEAD